MTSWRWALGLLIGLLITALVVIVLDANWRAARQACRESCENVGLEYDSSSASPFTDCWCREPMSKRRLW